MCSYTARRTVLTDVPALDCGYPPSSLKERVYALPGLTPGGSEDRSGILLYTATAGAQGTLNRAARVLQGAVDRSAICSNDPVCADREPDERRGVVPKILAPQSTASP